MASQTMNGKALEYAFIEALEDQLNNNSNIRILTTPAFLTAKKFFGQLTQEVQSNMRLAANAGIKNIINLEPCLISNGDMLDLLIQPDSQGQAGDVRDIVAVRNSSGWEIGISCKNNHFAVKHSRLSATIDIGKSWFGLQSTQKYFDTVTPIFEKLKEHKSNQIRWGNLPNKVEDYYVPVLQALIEELKRLDILYPGLIAKNLLMYLLGRKDFYKVIAHSNRRMTEIQGLNLYGTLNQNSFGKQRALNMGQLKLPTRFYNIGFKAGSSNTIHIICDEGWGVSARIHSASSVVESSLKLDVKLISVPPTMYRQTIEW